MNVRQPEFPIPPVESCTPTTPGYFSPIPAAIIEPSGVATAGRLISALRSAAQTKSATEILTRAVVAKCQPIQPGLIGNLAMPLADLAVTGRVAYSDFTSTHPQVGGPIQAAALARLTAAGTPGITPQVVQQAMSDVLDRAYQVAWFVRGQTARGNLGWIAVSGEDDLPHRPVNVARTMFQQHDLVFAVAGDLGAIPVRTRYAIATAANPVLTTVSLPQRSIPPTVEPVLPPNDRIILFIHGSDSRLEEAE